MRNVRLRIYLFGLLAAFTLNACQDHRLGPIAPGSSPTRMRVKSLTVDYPNNTNRIIAFTYDMQGRLSSLLAYDSPDSNVTWVEKTRFQYDAQNRLALEQYQRIARPNSIFGPITDQHQFSYNTAGRVTEIRYSSAFNAKPGQTIIDLVSLNDPNTLRLIGYPRYNAANQLSGLRKIYYSQQQPTTLETDNTYSYTGMNLTFANVLTTSNQGTSPFSRQEQYGLTYDTKVNPFYGVYMIPKFFGGIADTFQSLNTLSPNNIMTLGGISYRYEYNAANLPTVRYTYSDKLVETLRFSYEVY